MGKKSRRQAASGTPKLDVSLTLSKPMVTGGILIVLLFATLVAAQFRSQPRLQTYQITNIFPHDADAFTQGLEYDQICNGPSNECQDVLWESTGMNGASEVRLVDLQSGKVLNRTKLAYEDFGEGLVKHQGRLLQLTWRSNKVLSYSADNLADVKGMQTMLKDGWGVTNGGGEGKHLVISDGSSKLFFVDPTTLETKKVLQVKDDDVPVPFLNELEWVRGEIWANVWQTQCVARIHPSTGKIRGWILLHGLLGEARKQSAASSRPMDVLNGIAWDKERRRLFVTGKYWPSMFEIALRPHPGRLRPEVLEMARAQCIPSNAFGFDAKTMF